MFIRFVGKEIDKNSNVEKGIFTLAYELRDNGLLSKAEVEYLADLLNWFKVNLPIPSKYGSIIDNEEGRTRGICWFKDTSNETISKIWELKNFLQNEGILVDVLKVKNLGYCLYSDEFQVVAEPRYKYYKKLLKH